MNMTYSLKVKETQSYHAFSRTRNLLEWLWVRCTKLEAEVQTQDSDVEP